MDEWNDAHSCEPKAVSGRGRYRKRRGKVCGKRVIRMDGWMDGRIKHSKIMSLK